MINKIAANIKYIILVKHDAILKSLTNRNRYVLCHWLWYGSHVGTSVHTVKIDISAPRLVVKRAREVVSFKAAIGMQNVYFGPLEKKKLV